MPKFRKKPIIIEAVQYTGNNIRYITDELNMSENYYRYEDFELYINTLEGKFKADVGDWIIKGIKDEFYPCKPDIFEMTYETINS